jgi:excisionase family DNA binding protein
MALLTVKEVSAWLQVKPSTIYLWVAEGSIPALKINGCVRFQREQLAAWLETRQYTPPSRRAQPLTLRPQTDVDAIIASAKREVYTFAHGETRLRSSLIGKEERDGALEA